MFNRGLIWWIDEMLRIDSLHFAYKDRPVFRGLDLSAGEGELLGVVGPNGAGKSTLFRLVSGVLRPSSGQIAINGLDVSKLGFKERARLVCVVPQTPQLPMTFTALGLVLLGRNPHLRFLQWESSRDLQIAREAMLLTDTWRLAERPLSTLSGGERQRILVAMALAQQALLMLLDEPTASLDLAHQTAIMDLVRDVQRQRGGAVLVAMHDLTLAAQYCDRIVMLADGHAFADGPPQKVLTAANIARVYGAEVAVLPHPHGGRPAVLPIAGAHPAQETGGERTTSAGPGGKLT